MYKVKQEDLIGAIEGFPIEVVQRMVECQVEQGNKADVTIFQTCNSLGKGSGGFNFDDTEEKEIFWQKVIFNRDFKIFFEKYPKENKKLENNIRREFLNQEYDTKEINTERDGLTLKRIEKHNLGDDKDKLRDISSNVGLKYDNEKLRWDLLPLEDIEDVIKVYTEGSKKYAPNSWQNLPDGYNRYKAAMFRHLLEYEKGNIIDEETGCKHLAQVVWNAIAMLHVSKKINDKK